MLTWVELRLDRHKIKFYCITSGIRGWSANTLHYQACWKQETFGIRLLPNLILSGKAENTKSLVDLNHTRPREIRQRWNWYDWYKGVNSSVVCTNTCRSSSESATKVIIKTSLLIIVYAHCYWAFLSVILMRHQEHEKTSYYNRPEVRRPNWTKPTAFAKIWRQGL